MANPDTKSVGRSIMNFIKTFFDGEGRGALGRKFVNEFVHSLYTSEERELALQRYGRLKIQTVSRVKETH